MAALFLSISNVISIIPSLRLQHNKVAGCTKGKIQFQNPSMSAWSKDPP